VEIKRESKTLATVTFQNYFRLFKKLAGMTGTAKTEEEEFLQIYALETVVIPTNRPVARKDQQDVIFKNQRGKYMAVAKKVREVHEKGQPVLIGTVSIEKSEILSGILVRERIPHSVLNAKFHEQEAEIVSKAGFKGQVTIATNMAGRGTDIKIDDEVKSLGGLLVLGTERHESRRIDNQLRGRTGRQGDPGESQFFVSMDDDLMRLFSGDRIQRMMESLNLPDETPIQNGMISNSIESAQKKVEGRNFDIRKHLVEYDDVMNKHREIIYSRRRKALNNPEIKNDIVIMMEKEAERIVKKNTADQGEKGFNCPGMMEDLALIIPEAKTQFDIKELENLNDTEALIEHLKTYLFEVYKNKEESLTDPQVLRRLEKNISLSVIDGLWMDHIDNMQNLRESVSLRGYAQRDPLIEYKEQSYLMFSQLLSDIQVNTVSTLFKINLSQQLPPHLLKSSEANLSNLRTNEDTIQDNLANASLHSQTNPQGGASSGWALPQANPGLRTQSLPVNQSSDENGVRVVNVKSTNTVIDPNRAKLGRNDICPECGIKAKKCPHGNL
jgi:preprotein translocase subunit SecA